MSDEARIILTVDECRRLDAPLRDDLEIFDYEVRRLLARVGADARHAGVSEPRFHSAAATILLSIAAEATMRAAQQNRIAFDSRLFFDAVESASQWAIARRIALPVAGEA